MITTQTIALVIIIGFGLYGFATGLIRVIGSIVGVIIGAGVAVHYYTQVGGFLLPFLGNNQLVAGITAFTLLFFFSSSVVGMVFYLVDRLFKLVAIIPGLKAINRVAGLVAGLIEGILVVGVVLNAYVQLPLPKTTQPTVQNAPLLHAVMATTKTIVPGYRKALDSADTLLK